MLVKIYRNAGIIIATCVISSCLLLPLEHGCHWYLFTLFLFSAYIQLQEKIKLKMYYYSLSCTSNPGIWINEKKFYFGIQRIPIRSRLTFKPQLSQDSIRGEMQTSAPQILKIQCSNPIRIAHSVIMIAFKILPSIERGLTKPLFFLCPFTTQPPKF